MNFDLLLWNKAYTGKRYGAVMSTQAVEEKPTKNKEQTKQKMLIAVESILAKEGYGGLGINRIAKEAGVSKALIYRYFGGLEGLITAYGESDRFWPRVSEVRGMSLEEFKALSLRDRCKSIFRNFRKALEKRPHTVAIYAWEMVSNNEIIKNLIAVRTQKSMNVVNEMLSDGRNVYSDYDYELTALLGASLLHLTIREHLESPFAGLKLQEEHTWERIEKALDVIFTGLEAAYGSEQSVAS